MIYTLESSIIFNVWTYRDQTDGEIWDVSWVLDTGKNHNKQKVNSAKFEKAGIVAQLRHTKYDHSRYIQIKK